MDYLHQRIVLRKKIKTTNTWATEDDGIVLTDVKNIKVSRGLGKKRDAFGFDVRSPNNDLYEQYFNGTGAENEFTLKYSPIPSQHLSGSEKKFDVYVNDVLQTYTTNYSVSTDKITFVSAPASGQRNIKVVYPVVEADDMVDIYLYKNQTWGSMNDSAKNTARKEEGIITEPTIKVFGNVVNVRGFGLIDSIFSGMAFAMFDNDTVNRAHLVIQQIISQLNKFNPNRKIYGESPAEWANIGNSTPSLSVQYTSKYKSAIEMIEDLSGDKYTGDGQYIYYVEYDATNDRYEFNWKTKPLTSTGPITEGDEPNNIKIQKATDDVVNVVIYNCGNDPYGHGMEYLNYDFTITGYGAKWKYISETSTIGQDLVEAEFQADTSKWNLTSGGERNENFPKDASYPWTFQFDGRSAQGAQTGSSATAANDNAFSDAIRLESKWIGKFKTDDLIRLYSNPRFKATLFIPTTQDDTYVLGDIYELNFPSFGLANRKLRLMQIDYEFWGRQLLLEEDETTLEL